MKNRGGWPETIALILRDCDPEARLEFMRSLGVWKRISERTIRESEHEGDRLPAEQRLVKLRALEEHVQHEMDSDANWRAMWNDTIRRAWGA